MRFDVIVPAGGRAERLGGADKPSVVVGGRSLLERVVAAAGDATTIVIVGPTRPLATEVVWVTETRPRGPLVALREGLRSASEEIVVVLASDLPFVEPRDVERLLGAIGERDGAIAVDDRGRIQPLLAAYRTEALHSAGIDRAEGSISNFIAALDLVPVGLSRACIDCDTWDDVARTKEEFDARSMGR